MTARPADAVTWWVSLRSPYSWLALHDGQRRHHDLLRTARWRVFFEPDAGLRAEAEAAGVTFPYTPMSRAKHLYILRDVARLAAARGLTPTWPLDRAPDWTVPSLAVLAAGAGHCPGGPGGPDRSDADGRDGEECARALVLRLTRARWQEGRDIADREVVRRCAQEVGLPPAVADASTDPRWRAAGLDELRAVERDGVFGVPYVRVGREPFWGVDRLPAATDALLRARAADPARAAPDGAAASVPAGAGAAAPDGHAGGCG
ncbi:DsbA family protein [Cellulomonas shaoxiangyii]|uniref:2-hydroxychromene-2-carboxylate isomerase n=1 Tax=Cellulomonas shaoxiangyii TaxID=2566013 RepID=A0A4P7SEM1_9CELL|nr:DsbA family protein [Cellulomonas shaoxiangyii]QCB92290.1 2-hydroxychromene-2-carboxylate isomerase [Cellulomonas shaoxiangyii]TGY85898.1 2-hydroxychromene-2-carboxylate isomerase [Cellulomonas shaoxiangyii]